MATRFWVGGTGTWDSSTTTHWSATTGGAGGASVPGSSDTVTFDGASGGGTVTLNFGGAITVQSLTCGAFTGTIDNSVNNNNMTLTFGGGFSGSGSGTRTIKLGTATYTLSSAVAAWTFTTTTNLTFTGNTGCTIAFTGGAGLKTFLGGGLSYGTVTFGGNTGASAYSMTGANTFAALNISAPNYVTFSNSITQTISSAFTWTGTSSSPIYISSNSVGTPVTIAATAGSTAAWTGLRDITFTGSPTASNSLDFGNNSGVTINAPGPFGRQNIYQRGTPY